jgi:hydroxyethylthiazole kinase
MKSNWAVQVERQLAAVRARQPLVHNITNYVVMNWTANVLLALGASPVMAHAREEVEEMAGLSSALVLNIGTLSRPWVAAMVRAAGAARRKGIPIVLDPVGAGATRMRTESARKLLKDFRPDVLRGNASEIIALAGGEFRTKGVDAGCGVEAARAAATVLARKYRIVVVVTGPQDLITDGNREVRVNNGHQLMSRVTGTGCAATAVTGAFCAVEHDTFSAAVGALVVFGIAGELAARGRPGPGTYAVRLLDELDRVGPKEIRRMADVR